MVNDYVVCGGVKRLKAIEDHNNFERHWNQDRWINLSVDLAGVRVAMALKQLRHFALPLI